MLKRTLIVLIVAASVPLALVAGNRVPTVDDLLNLRSVGGAQISPDGRWVAYTVTSNDFKQNAYVTQVWLANTQTGRTRQLTRGDKSAGNPRWSPDSEWLAFASNRSGDTNQIFALHPDGGEAVQLTKSENSVGGFAWSFDGTSLAFTASDADSKAAKERQEYLGGFEVVRKEYD